MSKKTNFRPGNVTIGVAIACYNRRKTTIACLNSLHRQYGMSTEWNLVVYLLDDASTDGTREQVLREFPETRVIPGSGSMFWGGGMHVSMAAAIADGVDYILMLNDDVELYTDAIHKSLYASRNASLLKSGLEALIVGAVVDPLTSEITYSGFRRRNKWDPTKLYAVPPKEKELIECDTMNGNFVLIPRAIYSALGPVDRKFVHQLGDIDYGYRAVRAGYKVYLMEHPIGTCEPNNRKVASNVKGMSISARWRKINQPLALPLESWATFMWRWGKGYGIFRLLGIYTKRLLGK
ncbi:MAG: glycosyltransferase family 2 protein [Flavobacteriia bacterium]|nr:glycosyltransferase family 2 protein [Flavobacteriia bacterium]